MAQKGKETLLEQGALDPAHGRAFTDAAAVLHNLLEAKPVLTAAEREALHDSTDYMNVRVSEGESAALERIKNYLEAAGVTSKRGKDKPPGASDAMRYCILFTSLLLQEIVENQKLEEGYE